MSTLKPKQIEQVKLALLNLRDELNTQYALGQEATDTVILDQAKVGRLSRMDAMQQQKMAESNRQSTKQRLKKVLLALAKLDEDDYGYCDECANPIIFARLLIQPEANLCINCQSELEAKP